MIAASVPMFKAFGFDHDAEEKDGETMRKQVPQEAGASPTPNILSSASRWLGLDRDTSRRNGATTLPGGAISAIAPTWPEKPTHGK